MDDFPSNNVCRGRLTLNYDLCSKLSRTTYLTISFDYFGGKNFDIELHCADSDRNRSDVISLNRETLRHVAFSKTFGICDTIRTWDRELNGIYVTDGYSRQNSNVIFLDQPERDQLKIVTEYVLEDIERMTPYIIRRARLQGGLVSLKDQNDLKRLFYAYTLDLYENALNGDKNTDKDSDMEKLQCATKVVRNLKLHGFNLFLFRCGLSYPNELELELVIKTLMENENEMMEFLTSPKRLPATQVFIHFAKCLLCRFEKSF